MERVTSLDFSSADFHPVTPEDLVARNSRSQINRDNADWGKLGEGSLRRGKYNENIGLGDC
jgi:hypothetical protein